MKKNRKPRLSEIERNLGLMFSDPYYCVNIHPAMCAEHELLVSERVWIKAAAKAIRELGPEKFLHNLLNNLKGQEYGQI